MTDQPQHKAELIRDKIDPTAFRVERITEDGGIEVAIFSGPRALERAWDFADDYYEEWDDPEGLTMEKPQ